ncbi:MAG: hypothetical protein C0467_10725 [Planctomycetaceae bacterium]|nr:hypothetical protein [Planctomycetaceae bacterium]
MAELTKRRKWIGIAAASIISLAAFVYFLDLPPVAPTSKQARAALAERGWCSADEPITKRDGNVIIGPFECDLPNKTFCHENARSMCFSFSYSWEKYCWIAAPEIGGVCWGVIP